MKNICIEMPSVSRCLAIQCAYNIDEDCHARAITVGDGVHAGCDTFYAGSEHTSAVHRTAGVGACKCSQCQYNEDLECVAESITVAPRGKDVNCVTYTPR